MKKQLFVILFLLCAKTFLAQDWVTTWQKEKNFYAIRDSFNAYWKDKDKTVRGQGIKQFKRWADYVEPRVYPSGDLTQLGTTWQNYQDYLKKSNQKNISNNQTQSTTWTAMGPFGNLIGNATNGLPRKAGRLNFITFDPTNANIIWVGAAAGGLWKSTNGGVNWTTTNDALSVIGCTDLAIDPTNTNIMYLSTGDGYGSFRDISSMGVWKSIDGGLTWSATPLVFNVSQKIELRKIIINPVNPQIVMAAASNGIYRSTTAAATWSLTPVQAGNIYDLDFAPNNPDTVYAGGLSFRRSVDKGATWQQISNGIPTSGSNRMEVATTIANPNLVYVVSSASGTSGMQGFYKSTDRGTTFTVVATSPNTNLVGQDCFTTSGNSGQGWYDLGIDASATNANEVTLGALGV